MIHILVYIGTLPPNQSLLTYLSTYLKIKGVSGISGQGRGGKGSRGVLGMSRVIFTQQGQHNAELIPGKDVTTMQ